MGQLTARVQAAYREQPDLRQLLDPEAAEILGLTTPEVKTLVAVILTEGETSSAQELAELKGVKPHLFASCLRSLAAREVLAFDDQGRVDLGVVERALRVQHPGEVEAPEGEAPSVKMVLQPLTTRVVALARSGATPAAGLGRVYQFVFGVVPKGKDYGMLGLFAKELGRDQAALFLLENATNPDPNRLHSLLPLARAKAKGFRPADAPDEEEQRRWQAKLHRQARERQAT